MVSEKRRRRLSRTGLAFSFFGTGRRRWIGTTLGQRDGGVRQGTVGFGAARLGRPQRRFGRQPGRQPQRATIVQPGGRGLRTQGIADQVVGLPRGAALGAVERRQRELQLAVRQFAVDQRRDIFMQSFQGIHHVSSQNKNLGRAPWRYQRLSTGGSNKGRSFSAITSRARKMRLRTVPMGQAMISAISS